VNFVSHCSSCISLLQAISLEPLLNSLNPTSNSVLRAVVACSMNGVTCSDLPRGFLTDRNSILLQVSNANNNFQMQQFACMKMQHANANANATICTVFKCKQQLSNANNNFQMQTTIFKCKQLNVLSLLHHLHSLHWEPGKASKHVLHVDSSRVASAVWDFWIVA